MIITRLTVQELKTEVYPTLKQHWDEVDQRNKLYCFDPDWDLYQQLEDINRHFAICARDEGRVVGYVSSLVQPMLHCKGHLQIISEAFFVLPEYRSKGVGRAILEACKKVGQEVGANYWHLNIKANIKDKSLMEYLGLELQELSYGGSI